MEGIGIPAEVVEIIGKPGMCGEVTQVRVKVQDGKDNNRVITRNVLGLIRKGDILMLFTDGVTETMNEKEDEFEEKRLINFLKKNSPDNSPEKINQTLIKHLKRFAGNNLQLDDITLLTLKIVA